MIKHLKYLTLFLLFLPLWGWGQQTYFTPGVPPSSTSFTPTFRYNGTDSLANYYLANGNRSSQFYTSVQANSKFEPITDGIISGLQPTTISSYTATTPSGSWRINDTLYSKGSATVTTITPTSGGQYRQDILYATRSNTILLAMGVPGSSYTPPSIPDNTIPISNIYVTPTNASPGAINNVPLYQSGNQIKYNTLTFAQNVHLNKSVKLMYPGTIAIISGGTPVVWDSSDSTFKFGTGAGGGSYVLQSQLYSLGTPNNIGDTTAGITELVVDPSSNSSILSGGLSSGVNAGVISLSDQNSTLYFAQGSKSQEIQMQGLNHGAQNGITIFNTINGLGMAYATEPNYQSSLLVVPTRGEIDSAILAHAGTSYTFTNGVKAPSNVIQLDPTYSPTWPNETLSGTGGNGYLDLTSETSPASVTNHLRIYADSLNRLSWKNSLYRRTIRVTRGSDMTISTPYRLNPTLADSTDVATDYLLQTTAASTYQPIGTYLTPSSTNTLTNKSISGSTNTLSNIGNSSLTNSAITLNGTSTSLGGSFTVATANTDTTSTGFATQKSLLPYLSKANIVSTYVPKTTTVNGKALSANITLGLASSDFANQGTTTTVLHGNASGNPAFSQIAIADLSAAGTPSSTTYLRGDNTWATVTGATYANPTATIGLTAVNGSLTTAMRSDAAPALSQAIVPTWTGLHTFALTNSASSGTANYGLYVNPTGAQTGTAGFTDIYLNSLGTFGSGSHNLINLTLSNMSKFMVDNFGNTTTTGYMVLGSYVVTSGIYSVANTNFPIGQRNWSVAGANISVSGNTITNSSGQFNDFAITPTYNQTGTGAATDLLVNRIETGIGSGNQLLMDLQVGSSSKFAIDHNGVPRLLGVVGAAGQSPVVNASGTMTWASSGQTTLVAGTKSISISGLTTTSKAYISFVSVGGTVSTTWQYAGVCTSGTLTITALTNANTTDTTDTSTVNWEVIP